jgi:hypothetical protein
VAGSWRRRGGVFVHRVALAGHVASSSAFAGRVASGDAVGLLAYLTDRGLAVALGPGAEPAKRVHVNLAVWGLMGVSVYTSSNFVKCAHAGSFLSGIAVFLRESSILIKRQRSAAQRYQMAWTQGSFKLFFGCFIQT